MVRRALFWGVLGMAVLPLSTSKAAPPEFVAELNGPWSEDSWGDVDNSPGRGDEHGARPEDALLVAAGRLFGLSHHFPLPGSSGGVARGDFNGDGFGDLAVGVPGENVTSGKATFTDGGVVTVIYGSADGLTATSASVPAAQLWHQNILGAADLVETGDRFGAALASGDFNGDGKSDLAVAVPGEKNPAGERVGGVHVFYGAAAGLTATGNQLFLANGSSSTPSSPVFPASGLSLVWADFNGDGFGDLAIETRGANSSFNTVSSVMVLFGSAAGLTTSGRQVVTIPTDVGLVTESGYLVNLVLSAGDFDKDGKAELVVGAPFGQVGTRTAGKVYILRGTSTGVGSVSQTLSQPLSGTTFQEIAEAGDSFGAALAVGDFDGDSFRDLAVGVPGEDNGLFGEVSVPNLISNGGAVDVFFGSASGITPNNKQILYDWVDSVGTGAPGPGSNDRIGASLAAGDFDGDGFADLAIGAPGETLSGAASAGAVEVFYGSSDGLTEPPQFWHEGNVVGGGAPTAGESFGSALTAWNFGNDQHFLGTMTTPPFTLRTADLAIGVPFKEVRSASGTLVTDAGLVRVIYGSMNRLSPVGGVYTFASQTWHQDTAGVPDQVESSDRFGEALY